MKETKVEACTGKEKAGEAELAKEPRKRAVEVKRTDAPVAARRGRAHPLLALRSEVDRLFDDFSPWFSSLFPTDWRASLRTLGEEEAILPAVDLVEANGGYRLTAELPGLQEKDVEVTLTDDVLTVKGEKSEEREEKEEGRYLRERRYGSFRRSFQVPDNVEVDKIEASVANGVLTVVLPKKAEAVKPERKIEVRAA